MKISTTLIGSAAVLVLAGAGYWFWQRQTAPAPAPQPQAVVLPVSPPAASAATAATAASTPAVEQYPVAAPAATAAASAPQGVEDWLALLFGRAALKTIFISADFVPHFVATVDGLGRERASPQVWPVTGPSGPLVVGRSGDAEVIAGANGARYSPYVRLLDAMNLDRFMAAYRALYPQFQQAYRELGYPHGFFNDRFIAVLDQLIATPVPRAALRIRRPVVAGSQPTGGHVLYVFDDPALEAMAAGQKILLRMGPINERHVQARLKELRRRLAAGAR
ncbi:MAG: DUF3014 domain-containing protein [Burkholderiales bacterium]|nr:DUF3014 domain-containing protein [Burkholderiales bacterium]